MPEAAYDHIVAHYQEVGLKGRNRSFFERVLIGNIARAVGVQAQVVAGRLVMRAPPDIEHALNKLQRVFGLSSFAPAVLTSADMGEITSRALELAGTSEFGTFAVRARKGHSSFPEGGQTVNEVVGRAIKDRLAKKVDLSDPDWTCHIELVFDRAYVYWDKRRGPGGLPVGSSGRLICLLSGGIDSPVAAWMMAKRGASIDCVHFHGQPFSDPSSVRQAQALVSDLAPWIGKVKLWAVPFGELQSEIVSASPQELRVVLYRRFMMRIAAELAQREGASGLVTGESLGQVASQTLPNIAAIDAVVPQMPVLRPLVGLDKVEIERLARQIGTYETSIQPHQDCCVLFIPRRVTTAARLDLLYEAESNLEVEAMVKRGSEAAELLT